MSVPRAQSVTRAAALLKAIERSSGTASTAALARTAELHPATAARLLATLEDAGFAERTEDGWAAGPDLVRVAQRADPYRGLARRVQPVLQKLAETARESAMLGVPRPGHQVRVVAQADGPWLLGPSNWVGRHIDSHASAAGKLVLAELDDRALAAWVQQTRPTKLTPRTHVTYDALRQELDVVRRQGWAAIDEESEPGLASVAVPLRDQSGSLVAMIGFSGAAHRIDPEPLIEPLRSAARELS